jgi:D-3-phosphoglycerate dehydrogenase
VAEITVYNRHLSESEAAEVLAPFDVLCTMRERMALPRRLLQRLGRLKLITIVGRSLANLDLQAASDLGVLVVHSDFSRPALAAVANATPELAFGLIIATVRHWGQELSAVRGGLWQSTTGVILAGRTLGLLGLGRIGRRVAAYGRAFDMEVTAWSQNLTAAGAEAVQVRRVEKDELFASSDVLSIHLQLSDRTRGLVTARELALMKPTAFLVNTSRGPIVEEAALLSALTAGRLAGAGLDVFDEEPLPKDHPFRSMTNVTATPHLGYATLETLKAFYADVPEAVAAYAAGVPVRVLNPDAAAKTKT